MLLPVVFVLAFVIARMGAKGGGSAPGLPLFLVGFAVLVSDHGHFGARGQNLIQGAGSSWLAAYCAAGGGDGLAGASRAWCPLFCDLSLVL